MAAPRLLLINDGLGPNKGDQAILAAMRVHLAAALPGAELPCIANSDLRRPGAYLAYWRALAGADLVVFGGGQEIQDHASLAFLVSGLLKIALARLRGRPVFGYALGVGPVATRAGRWLCRLVLNRMAAVTVRDEASLACLRALGVTRPPCTVTADPALDLAPVPAPAADRLAEAEGIPPAAGPRVVIAPRRWFHYAHYWLPMGWRARLRLPVRGQARFRRLEDEIAAAADELVESRGAQVVFLAMRRAPQRRDPGQDDDLVGLEIRAKMRHADRAYVVRGDYPPDVLKAFLAQADVVVAMRMHALILAAMGGRPVVGIELAAKTGSLLERLGLAEYGVPVECAEAKTLARLAGKALDEPGRIRATLEVRGAALRELARSTARHAAERVSATP